MGVVRLGTSDAEFGCVAGFLRRRRSRRAAPAARLEIAFARPLIAANGRWGAFGGVRHGVLQLVKVVTAFTVGHSITLIVGALGWLRLSSQPVEILIALSIFVSAIHALRPCFVGREPVGWRNGR
jgi:hypothetical protein